GERPGTMAASRSLERRCRARAKVRTHHPGRATCPEQDRISSCSALRAAAGNTGCASGSSVAERTSRRLLRRLSWRVYRSAIFGMTAPFRNDAAPGRPTAIPVGSPGGARPGVGGPACRSGAGLVPRDRGGELDNDVTIELGDLRPGSRVPLARPGALHPTEAGSVRADLRQLFSSSRADGRPDFRVQWNGRYLETVRVRLGRASS